MTRRSSKSSPPARPLGLRRRPAGPRPRAGRTGARARPRASVAASSQAADFEELVDRLAERLELLLDLLVHLGGRPVLCVRSRPGPCACSRISASSRRVAAPARGRAAESSRIGRSSRSFGMVEARAPRASRRQRRGRATRPRSEPGRPSRLPDLVPAGDDSSAVRSAQASRSPRVAVGDQVGRAPRGPGAGRTRRPARSGRRPPSASQRADARGQRLVADGAGDRLVEDREVRVDAGRRSRGGGAGRAQNSWNVPIGAASRPRRTARQWPASSPGAAPARQWHSPRMRWRSSRAAFSVNVSADERPQRLAASPSSAREEPLGQHGRLAATRPGASATLAPRDVERPALLVGQPRRSTPIALGMHRGAPVGGPPCRRAGPGRSGRPIA